MSASNEICKSYSTFEIDDPVDTFTGRLEELKNLHVLLEKNEKYTVIFGMGGVGKTEMVRKYVQNNKTSYEHILFINAENHFQMRLSFVKIAETLGLAAKNSDGTEKDDKLIISTIYQMIQGKKCLFIMDNATNYQKHENPDISCRSYLPLPASEYTSFRILFTTRNSQFYKNGNTIELTTFSQEESTELLKKSLASVICKESDFIKLHNYMEGLPLGLQQAAALIKVKNQESLENATEKENTRNKIYGVSDYLAEYDAAIKIPHDNSYTKTVYTTWEVSLNHIKNGIKDIPGDNNRIALKMLQMCAYYSPDGINVEMFEPLVQFNLEKLASILRIPKQYSMFQLSKGTIRIHRLVQKVIRLQMENDKKEEDFLKWTLDLNLHLLHKNYISPFNHVHLIHLWNHTQHYKLVVTEFSKTPWSIAQFMLLGGFYNSAADFCKIAGPEIKLVIGEKLEDTFESLNNVILVDMMLANCLQRQGKFMEAVEMFKKVLAIQMQSQHFGPEHPNTNMTENYIGQCLFRLGKYDEALTRIENLLDRQRKIHEQDDGRILNSLITKAAILNEIEDKEGALEIYNDVVAMETQRLSKATRTGGKDKEIVTTMILLGVKNNIANIFMDKCEFNEALKIFTEVREMLLKARDHGKNHPLTIEVSMNLAILLSKMGQNEEALAIYEDVINLPQLPPLDPIKVKCEHSKAWVLIDLDRLTEAKTLLVQVVEKREEIYGKEHTDTLLAKYNLALCLNYLGNFAEAESIIDDVIQVSRKCFGDEYRNTIEATTLKANLLRSTKHFEEALEILERNYEIQVQIGERISGTLNTLKTIGLCQYELGRLTESSETYKKVLKLMVPVYGEKHHKVTDIINNMAVILYDQGTIEQSLEMQLANFKTRMEILPLDHPDLKCTIESILKMYEENRMYSELNIFITDHYHRCSYSLGNNHPTTLYMIKTLISTKIEYKNYKEAFQLCHESLEYCKSSPSSSELALRCIKALCLRKLKKYNDAFQEIKLSKKIENDNVYFQWHIKIEEVKILNALTNRQDFSPFVQIYKEQCKLLIPESSLVLITLQIISNIFRNTGRFKQSLIVNSYIHDEFCRIKGSGHRTR